MTDYLDTLGSFEKAIKRGAGHIRSAELDHALDAIKRYIKDGRLNNAAKNKANIERVNQTLGKWQKLHPKECTNRGAMTGPIHDGLKAELDTHMARWGGVSYAATAQAAPTWTPSKVKQWVESRRTALELLGTYACGDLLHPPHSQRARKPGQEPDWTKGFAALANAQQRAVVWSRYQKTAEGPAAQHGMHLGRGWKANQYSGIFHSVTTGKRGVCTTFAQAAAHVLTNGQAHGPRIEVVSWGGHGAGHVYVLVNRQGGYAPNDIVPDTWVNEPDIVVIDAWHASLGWNTISFGRGQLKHGMVKGLVCTGEKSAW